MNPPIVSAIIPTFNGEKTIRETLGSVFAQDYPKLEVVVVDDASTDGTVQALREYGDRIRLIRRKMNSGICEIARSEGVAAAHGKYCAFIDQDDLWRPEKTTRQSAFLEHHPELPLCHAYMRVIDKDGKMLRVRHEGAIPPTGPCARELLSNCFVTYSAIMVRREAWLAAYPDEPIEDAHTDWDSLLKILRQYPAGFGFIPEVMGSYRIWPASVSRQGWRRIPRDVIALDRVYRRNLWKGLMPWSEARQILLAACLENSQHWRDRGEYGRAAFFALRALRRFPLSGRVWASLGKAWGKALMKPRISANSE